MNFVWLLLIAMLALGQSPAGVFVGELSGGMVGKLRLGLEVKMAADGTLSGEMVSIDQAYAKLPAKSIVLEGKTLKIALGLIAASYEGVLSEDGATITGTFTQGAPIALIFKRVSELPKPARPQEPKPPFPYESEDVSFAGGAADVTLAGTFTKPMGAGKFAAIVLISGSGPQDRNEEIALHKPFLVWSDTLTRAGFAVLRYDDRGTARSTGKFKGSTSVDFGKDAAGAVAYLRGRKDIDAAKIVVMGHSEGGMIAPILAAEDAKLAGIVLLAGPGVSGERILRKQVPDLNRAAGMNEEASQANAKMILERLEATRATDPWMANFWDYDPATALRKVKCPVLALNGELDKQVNAVDNLGAIEAALKEGGNRDVTIRTMPKLNHLFQTAVTGGGQEYGKIEETVAPLALDTVTLWLKKTLAMK